MMNPNDHPRSSQPEPAMVMTDDRIKEIMNKWSKEPQFAEFEINDFLSCVKDIFSEEMKSRQISLGTVLTCGKFNTNS